MVAHFVLKKTLYLGKIDEVADRMNRTADAQQVPNGGTIRVTAGQWGKVLETKSAVGLLDCSDNDIRSVESYVGERFRKRGQAARDEHWLKRNSADMRMPQAKFD